MSNNHKSLSIGSIYGRFRTYGLKKYKAKLANLSELNVMVNPIPHAGIHDLVHCTWQSLQHTAHDCYCAATQHEIIRSTCKPGMLHPQVKHMHDSPIVHAKHSDWTMNMCCKCQHTINRTARTAP